MNLMKQIYRSIEYPSNNLFSKDGKKIFANKTIETAVTLMKQIKRGGLIKQSFR